jgi:hypothetical protein
MGAKDGFGMLENIVGAAVGLAVVGAASVAITKSNRLSKKAFSTLDISNAKQNLYSAIDCGMTLANLPLGDPCAGRPGYIPLISLEGKILVAASGSAFGSGGDYVLRAYCHDGSVPGVAKGIEVRAVKLYPRFVRNVSDISWVGVARPPNPSHYIKDEVRGPGGLELAYDWNHPKSILSTPGPGGLCSSRFGNNVAALCTYGANQYIKSVDFDAQTVECGTIPTCSDTETLEFSANNFTCNSSLYTTITDNYIRHIDSQKTITINEITRIANIYQDRINTTRRRLSLLGSVSNGVTTSNGASDDLGCSLLRNGSCPPGYLMTGYEARINASGDCRSSCVMVAPP